VIKLLQRMRQRIRLQHLHFVAAGKIEAAMDWIHTRRNLPRKHGGTEKNKLPLILADER
jgi:hypothetical protein